MNLSGASLKLILSWIIKKKTEESAFNDSSNAL
jgi:hypothetical protein